MTLSDLKKLDTVLVNCTWRILRDQSIIEQFDHDYLGSVDWIATPVVSSYFSSILHRVSINNKTWYIAAGMIVCRSLKKCQISG